MDNQDFKKLKAEWDAKLKASGFDDIEYGNGDLLKHSSSNRTSHHDGGPWEPKAEYYRLAHYFLNEFKFKTRLEEIVWTYHSEGISVRNIVITLNKVRRKKVVRMTVWRIIERLRTQMKKLYGVR